MKESGRLRFLDRYLGSLLCFFFSFFHFKKARPSTIKKVLFIELFEMGAAVMAYPSIRLLQEKNPNVELFCLCLRGYHQSWDLLGCFPKDNLITVDGSSLFRFSWSLIHQIWKLRKLNIDLVLNLEKFSRISALISFFTGARIKVGFYRYEYEGLYRGKLQDVDCAFNQNMHISKNFLALTKAGLSDNPDYPNFKGTVRNSELHLPKYSSDSALKKRVQSKLAQLGAGLENPENKRLVLISPDVGPNLSTRNYPVSSFAQVIRKLLAKHSDARVLVTGVPENRKICKELVEQVGNENCINFCGQSETVREFVELIEMSSLVITNDNGPAHFAALTSTQVLALFSIDSPYMYGPLGNCVILYSFFHCSPCVSALNNKRSTCQNNLCIQSLPVNQVFEFASGLLEKRIKSPSLNGVHPYILETGDQPTIPLRRVS